MCETMDKASIPKRDRIVRYYDSKEEMIKEVKLALSDGEWTIV